MESAPSTSADDLSTGRVSHGHSAASWGAIVAGALVAASMSLALLALGTGLGFASVSPWREHGVTATAFAVETAIWIIVMQWVSAFLGGYIAGRLRTRWIGTHTHEVFFRDSAHGLVAWALATVLVASLFASSVYSLIGGGVQAANTIAAAGGVEAVVAANPSVLDSYSIDKLFRATGDSASGADHRGEVSHILANAVTTGTMLPADRTYLTNLVAQKTGLSREEAQIRVDKAVTSAMDTQAKVKEVANEARKAAAQAAIYLALSMLIGAFIASVSAILGGRLRDQHP